MNVVVLIGRMVADPELRYTPGGIAVTSLRIAVDKNVKSEGGEKQADFFDIVAWEKSAEYAANYLTKGQRIAVQGRLQQRSWVQQDGQKRYKVEVVAQRLQGLDRPQGNQGTAAHSYGTEPSPAETSTPDAETGMDYDPFADE